MRGSLRDEDREAELAQVIAEVRRIDVQASRLVNQLIAGGYSSVFRGMGIEFEAVREYVEGDDPRTVDWNVTARMGRPFVKTYVDERELVVVFLFDLSASMSGGFGAWSARQTAARLCACLALSAVRNHDRSGLIAFSGKVDRYVPPKKGSGHVLRIVRDCLALPGRSPHTNLGAALDFATRVLPRRAILFVVSDFLTAGWQEALSHCARRHDVIAARMLMPELQPPETGMMRLRDPERGEDVVIDWRSRRMRHAYLERIRAWRQRTDDGLARAGVDLMDVPVPLEPDFDAVARPILGFFRMRERRGGRA